MARRPAAAKAPRRRPAGPRDPLPGDRRGLSPLVLATLGVAAVFGALVIWLALSAEPNRAPMAVVTLPPLEGAAPASPEPLPLAPAADAHHTAPAGEHGAVGHDAPGHDAPAHEAPAHDAPAHDAGAHDAGGPEAAAHDAPAHDAPAHDAGGTGDAHGTAPAGDHGAAAPEAGHGADPHASDAHGADAHGEGGHGEAAHAGGTGLPAPPATMVVAPDPALVQDGPSGPLPIVAPDGRAAWHTYARAPAAAPGTPRIAIIVSGLGLKQSTTNQAVRNLPPDVTLAYSPYARGLTEAVAAARAAGHEVLIQVPMEPADYPTNDPGPQTLLVRNKPDTNIQRLEWSLGRAVGYVGIVPMMGSRILGEEEAMTPVIDVLKTRGLMLVDSRATPNSVAAGLAAEAKVPRALVDTVIDLRTSRTAIDARLAELERQAKASGLAIGLASDYPVSLERIAVWAQDLERRGIALVPVTALANQQKID